MKYYLAFLLIFAVGAFPAEAALTKSAQITKASNQFFTAPDTASISITGSQTWEMWIKYNSTPNLNNEVLMTKFDVGGSRSFAWWVESSAGAYSMRIFTTSDGSTLVNELYSMATPSTNVWYHYRVTYDTSGPTLTAYVDGVSLGAGVGSIASSIKDGTSQLTIGGNYSPLENTTMDAQFSTIRIWSTVHTANDKCTVYGTATAGLAAEWSLDNVLTDASGNGNTLTNNNAAAFISDTPPCVVTPTFAPWQFWPF